MSPRGAKPTNADTMIQFRLIQEINRILGSAQIRFWLRGGWALDFLIGEVSRPHSDIDLVTWRRHAGRIRRLLAAHSYQIVKVDGLAAIHLSKRGQDIGIVFGVRQSDGTILTPGYEHWPWPRSPLPLPFRRLRGISCRTMSLEALREEKESYERYTGRSLRPKDRDSIIKLRSFLSASDPLRRED